MPNWCSNVIEIRGPKNKIEKIWEDAQAKDGLLEAMVPIGEWDYATAADTWGTKWDVSLEGLEYQESSEEAMITGWFDSAWAPPIDAYCTFLSNNEDCEIEASYHESGMDFAGIFENGTDDECNNVTEQCQMPESERSDLFKELDDRWNLVEEYEMWNEEE